MPLGYEISAGNRNDATTLKEMVEHIEGLYGRAQPDLVMDPRAMAGRGQRGVSARKAAGATIVRERQRTHCASSNGVAERGLAAGACRAGSADHSGAGGQEVFILCRSAERRAKEQAMHERFDERCNPASERFRPVACEEQTEAGDDRHTRGPVAGRNTRAAALFEVKVEADAGGFARYGGRRWKPGERWARLSEGCYVLRSNVTDWSPEDLWRAYIQLTEAEAAFHIHKSDLGIRRCRHQKEDRVQAHILVCFLAYVLWKTLAASCREAGLGDEPRKCFEALSEIAMVGCGCCRPRSGRVIASGASARPTEHQQILLQRLGLKLPQRAGTSGNVVETRPCGA